MLLDQCLPAVDCLLEAGRGLSIAACASRTSASVTIWSNIQVITFAVLGLAQPDAPPFDQTSKQAFGLRVHAEIYQGLGSSRG